MRWLKRDIWKAGLVVAGVLLFLILMILVPVSRTGAHETVSESATPGTVTVQITPQEDATVTALNKDKLQHENDWWWNNGATILTSLISTLTLAAAGIFTVVRYFNDRRDTREKQEAEANNLAEERKAEREKRAEERFQAAVEGLSSEREEAKIGAAILLRTFLRPGYEEFYAQTFDLAVANLRLPRTSHLPEDPDGLSRIPEDPATPLPLTTLSQALILVFKEALPLALSQNKGDARSLDATGIQLDNAYLALANLKQVRMPHASLRKANFSGANLSGANLRGADLRQARLHGVNGLTKEQLETCKANGALLDEDPTISSSQSPISPPLPS